MTRRILQTLWYYRRRVITWAEAEQRRYTKTALGERFNYNIPKQYDSYAY